ncbi:hypothetical protein TNCV_1686561, partial [Trichonephila clavipes]
QQERNNSTLSHRCNLHTIVRTKTTQLSNMRDATQLSNSRKTTQQQERNKSTVGEKQINSAAGEKQLNLTAGLTQLNSVPPVTSATVESAIIIYSWPNGMKSTHFLSGYGDWE